MDLCGLGIDDTELVCEAGRSVSREDFCFLKQLSRTEWPLVPLSQSLVLWGYLLLSLLEMGPSQVIFFFLL